MGFQISLESENSRRNTAWSGDEIKAEERATGAIAGISESEKASAWRAAFNLASKFIERANQIHDVQPVAAATLTRTAFTILESVRGGVAGGFRVNVGVVNQAAQQFPAIAFNADGQRIEGDPNLGMSYEEACKMLDAPAPLPCSNWSKDSPDATPTFEPEPERGVPSRINEVPIDGPPTSEAEPGFLPSYLIQRNRTTVEPWT
jgi:hypothetical protein